MLLLKSIRKKSQKPYVCSVSKPLTAVMADVNFKKALKNTQITNEKCKTV
ncbi:hypothetical protein NU08_2604 [Flavobacterium anhuiense]|uniref:Uncharacterized protein n=1 Tax=Flavobacterium anhuiense TaxID=459526 RepID=A0A444VXG0_9FLAO|nr:hypothetical protein NU08_2604 [Flavobacterium anhuiense]